jgi:hypothetical protein
LVVKPLKTGVNRTFPCAVALMLVSEPLLLVSVSRGRYTTGPGSITEGGGLGGVASEVG